MKISNFKLKRITGDRVLNYRFYATVDIENGFFNKKTITADICQPFAGPWFFVKTGEFTPGHYVDELVRAFEAIHGKELRYLKSECEDD